MADETPDRPTIDDHPGLDNDEATDEGKMMTAEGSTGESRRYGRALRRSRIIPGSTTTRRRTRAR